MAINKSKSRRKIILFTVVLLSLAGLGSAAFLRKREHPIAIQVEKVGRRSLTETVVATGKIQPVVQVVISPEVSGEIIELPVKEGQLVKKGDLLVRLKPDLYQAALRSAQASHQSSLAGLTLSEANLRKAQLEHDRFKMLFQNNLVSDSQYLEAKTALEVAAASRDSSRYQGEMAGASLARSQEDLSRTTILAPADGTVTKLKSQLGERVVGTAMMTGTEIMTIADLNAMEARVEVSEIDVPLIRLGQKARIEADSFRDRKFNGIVTEIANAARATGLGTQQESTKFEVRILIAEKEAFRPGMSVTAEVETRYRTNVIAVPRQSVTTRLPKEELEKRKQEEKLRAEGAEEESPAQAAAKKKAEKVARPIEVVFLRDGLKVKMVPVKRGISDDAFTEITEGLDEGVEVVSGTYKAIGRELEDGKLVKVEDVAKPKPKPQP